MTLARRLALIEVAINAEKSDPKARRLDSKVYLSRDERDFAVLEIVDHELVLWFYGAHEKSRVVTAEKLGDIVATIEAYVAI